jgi:glutathione S-transferase
MLEEIGAPYERKVIHFGDAANDFSAINRMRKVPVIVHKGTTVTECPAICAYLADAFPEAGLAPTSGERGLYYRWLFFAAGPLEAAASNHSVGWDPAPDKQVMFGYGDFKRVMDTLEEAVSANPYIAGDRFTAADVYVGAHVWWGLQFGTFDKRPGFEDYVARIIDRDGYRRATEKDDADMAQMQKE